MIIYFSAQFARTVFALRFAKMDSLIYPGRVGSKFCKCEIKKAFFTFLGNACIQSAMVERLMKNTTAASDDLLKGLSDKNSKHPTDSSFYCLVMFWTDLVHRHGFTVCVNCLKFPVDELPDYLTAFDWAKEATDENVNLESEDETLLLCNMINFYYKYESARTRFVDFIVASTSHD